MVTTLTAIKFKIETIQLEQLKLYQHNFQCPHKMGIQIPLKANLKQITRTPQRKRPQ
jgi:hypothetical protein